MGVHPEPLVYLFGSKYVAINYATVFNSIVVMGLLILTFYLLGRSIRMKPGKAQIAMEFIVGAFDDFCAQALGKERGRKFLPYIGSLFLYIWWMNLIGIIPFPGFRIFGFPIPAIREPTRDFMTTGGLGIIVIAVEHISEMRVKGVWRYIKGYFEPFFLLFPLNVIGKLAEWISLSFRLFGNIFGGAVIIIIVGMLLGDIFLPAVLNVFFGLFVGTVQAFVFSMLALTYAAVAIAED
jgi:F-type H+-transporting ATPase subunit a